MSIDKGMDKEDVVYGTLLSHKKDEIMPFAATWTDLEIIVLSEVLTHQRKTNMTSLICRASQVAQC